MYFDMRNQHNNVPIILFNFNYLTFFIMSQTVVGIFDSVLDAEKAVDRLLTEGFARERVDVADQTAEGNKAATKHDDDSIGGFFSSLFGDSDDTKYHTDAARTGTVVTVHATSMEEAQRAADLMDQYGTINVNERAGVAHTGDADQKIDVVEEELHVGKREVQTGGVRVRSRIIERPVEEHVRLRSEHVNVTRKPVDRPVGEGDLNTFKEGTIEMTETAEQVVASKEARVVEEVHVGKEVREKEEVVADTVRHTEVDVEEVDAKKRLADEKLAKEKANPRV